MFAKRSDTKEQELLYELKTKIQSYSSYFFEENLTLRSF